MKHDMNDEANRYISPCMNSCINRCLDCRSFNLKEVPELARHGFGWCGHRNLDLGHGKRSRSVTVSANRACCAEFSAAPAQDVQQRMVWLAQQGTAGAAVVAAVVAEARNAGMAKRRDSDEGRR